MKLALRLRARPFPTDHDSPASLGGRFFYAALAQSERLKNRLQPRNKESVACTTERRPYHLIQLFSPNSEIRNNLRKPSRGGKKPRWLTAQLKAGKQIDDFRIELVVR